MNRLLTGDDVFFRCGCGWEGTAHDAFLHRLNCTFSNPKPTMRQQLNGIEKELSNVVSIGDKRDNSNRLAYSNE